MFSYPATEVFSAAGDRRVVWSTEEYEAALAEGWLTELPQSSEQPADAPKKSAKKGK